MNFFFIINLNHLIFIPHIHHPYFFHFIKLIFNNFYLGMIIDFFQTIFIFLIFPPRDIMKIEILFNY
jgi:hypothetical protein